MTDCFIKQIGTQGPINPNDNVYGTIFKEYERVIINSIITSFGLDLFIQNRIDQHGGDVDTIHNVRKIGADPQMKYKNNRNESNYLNKEKYNFSSYHSDSNFANIKHEQRERWQETGQKIRDEYTNNDIGFYGHTGAISSERKAELDHIVECKAIHEDRGRVLSGLSGIDLANTNENLAFTNKSLNASMGAWARSKNDAYRKEHGCDAPMEMTDMRAYVNEHPNLDPETKKNMLEHYDKAKKAYDKKISQAYYTSRDFFTDSAKATAKVGIAMGARQALGFVFSEIWFAVKEEIHKDKITGETLFNNIGLGIKKGLANAKSKYKDIWNKFIEGSISGILSSITTTLCNIFFTTSKNIVRITRQSWSSLVEAAKILLFNPDCLPFGERFRAASKIIAAGASVIVGSLVSVMIEGTVVGSIPIIGDIIKTFCMTFITGIMSCSLLYLLDHNSKIKKLVEILNTIPTIDDSVLYYRQQAKLLEEYCSKLQEIDIETFKQEVNTITDTVAILENVQTEKDLHIALKSICLRLNIANPYGDCKDINDFMANPNTVLKFC